MNQSGMLPKELGSALLDRAALPIAASLNHPQLDLGNMRIVVRWPVGD